jgi:hypothetical protein
MSACCCLCLRAHSHPVGVVHCCSREISRCGRCNPLLGRPSPVSGPAGGAAAAAARPATHSACGLCSTPSYLRAWHMRCVRFWCFAKLLTVRGNCAKPCCCVPTCFCFFDSLPAACPHHCDVAGRVRMSCCPDAQGLPTNGATAQRRALYRTNSTRLQATQVRSTLPMKTTCCLLPYVIGMCHHTPVMTSSLSVPMCLPTWR